jgi:hypothetical protein
MAHAYDFYKPNLASEYPVIFPNPIFTRHFSHLLLTLASYFGSFFIYLSIYFYFIYRYIYLFLSLIVLFLYLLVANTCL